MAKLYINKDIVADSDKFENWIMTGDDGISFPDVQAFIDWIDLYLVLWFLLKHQKQLQD